MTPAGIDRAVGGLLLGLTTFGAGIVTIAQGVLDPEAITIERILGGGVLVVVALLIVRWSRQSTADMRITLQSSLDATQDTLAQTMTILAEERAAWSEERRSIKSERDHLRAQLMETQALLTEERNLRLSLEKAGLTDRRQPPAG